MAGATHHVRIDRAKTLAEEPGTGHNRWHEAIPPVVTVAHPPDIRVLFLRSRARQSWGSTKHLRPSQVTRSR